MDSVLSPIFSTYFFGELVSIVKDINVTSYANNNTLYKLVAVVDDVSQSSGLFAERLFKWFADNQRKGNTDNTSLLRYFCKLTVAFVKNVLVFRMFMK